MRKRIYNEFTIYKIYFEVEKFENLKSIIENQTEIFDLKSEKDFQN